MRRFAGSPDASWGFLMPCYHPITAFRSTTGRDPTTKKWPIVFNTKQGYADLELKIPCGRCIGCRLERSRQWAMRCIHEAETHSQNCFITLTYNNDTLPSNLSLVKKDFQDFMKRLREKVSPLKIRFFHCGEYGEQYERPHYHSLIFGLDFSLDRYVYSVHNGNKLYRSPLLESAWTLGNSMIGDLTFESAAYVARYILKKVTGKAAADHYGDRLPEYITMSRGNRLSTEGGIGSRWFRQYQGTVIRDDHVVLRGGIKLRPPKFYDKLYEKHHPDEMDMIKRRRAARSDEIDQRELDRKEQVKQYLLKQQLKRTIE